MKVEVLKNIGGREGLDLVLISHSGDQACNLCLKKQQPCEPILSA